jgi:signal transduction histidine kinase
MALRAARRPRRSIRTGILIIAWIPSFTLIAVGVIAAGTFAFQATQNKNFAISARNAIAGVAPFVLADQREREITVLYLADPSGRRAALEEQRAKTDATLAGVQAATVEIRANASDGFSPIGDSMSKVIASLPELRKKVDSGSLTPHAAAQSYASALGPIQLFFGYLLDNAASAEIAKQITLGANLFWVAEWRSQNESIQIQAYSTTGISAAEFAEMVQLTGGYHKLLTSTIPQLPAQQQAGLRAITSSVAWEQLMLVEKHTLETSAAPRGAAGIHRAGALPLDRKTWQAASAEISSKLLAAYGAQALHSSNFPIVQAQRAFSRALFIGLGLLLLGLAVLVLVTRLSARLVGRLRRLQTETLKLANVQLPAIVDRLRGGEKVDLERELPRLDHGDDEIGGVAAAFNQAQQAAIAAAVLEAATRAGTEKVFRNIAHRNQLIAHHQLKVLDQAERSQEDPDQLDLLFQLDHLATRARRNAENLIILGGGQAGRRWRNPVALQQVVRSAMGEAETYTRVSTGRVPSVSVTGAAVADLVHLLAELIDNATSFSPPSARVEVRGNVVGRGVVIEIEDQGLGIEPNQLEELNAMLQSSPDFGLMALAEEPRLGLFVVTQLAMRHGIRVTLTDSPSYGGTRAVVLIPTALISATGVEALGRVPLRLEQVEIMHGGAEVADSQPRTLRASRVLTLAPDEPPAPQYSPESSPTTGQQRVHTGPIGAHSLPRSPQTAEIPQVRRAPANPVVPAAPQPFQGFAEAVQAVQAAAQSHQPPPHRPPGSAPHRDERPNLPRRTRQTHLAPQLQAEMPAVVEPQAPPRDRPSAEHARDRLAAFQRGTRQGRETPPDPAM